MLRLLRFGFLALFAVLLITLAMANRDPVTLSLLPVEAGSFLGWDWVVQLPLFLVIFAALLLGLMIGFFWEWLRESQIRASAGENARRAARLEREVKRLGGGKPKAQDEVLALLEDGGRAR
ncbi:lipopolysaccharide assembly protein LapA domain-containing protein [Phaeovulum sp. W22_SRMD_FR3]|uniref:lipopolysaccharide assembly protein LapA domain-containing protein n=1 Tax=Phaeovulum sp. W22_SRMD_FR3 TaxID=3240274 RepID=UPI003F98AE4E